MKDIKFGLQPDLPDFRDYFYNPVIRSDFPNRVNLLESFGLTLKDQGNVGSCTAFATTSMIEYVRAKQGYRRWDASPLFTYYATRTIENTVDSDSGAAVRNALKSAVQYGVVKEKHWNYDESKLFVKPPDNVWEEAEEHQALSYYRVNSHDKISLLSCLTEGYPFTFGVRLYSSFYDCFTKEAIVLPVPTKEEMLGGHCMLCVGYELAEDGGCLFLVQNSWGTSFGRNGITKIPLEYFTTTGLAMDFWTVRLAEGDARDLDPSLSEEAEVVVEPPAPEPPVVIVEVVVPPEPNPEPSPSPKPPKPAPSPVVEPQQPTENKYSFHNILKYLIIALGILVALGFILL